MKKAGLKKIIKLSVLVILILLVSVFILSSMSKKEETDRGKGEESTASEKVPIGNQAVEEKTKQEGMNMEEGKEKETSQSPKGFTEVQISPEKQQTIGVKTDEVATRKLISVIRTVGAIESNETRIARVSIKFSGWIKDVFVDYVGKYVRRGEPLFTVYSPDLVSTQQEYLLALRAQDTFGKSSFSEISSGAKSLLEATRERFLFWDIPESEIKRIERTGKPLKYLTLYSPISGYVTKREAFPEKMVTPNDIVFEVVDLSTLWLLADIYEYEIPLVKEGQEATLTLSYYPEQVFRGKVRYIYPTLETTTRTVKVRFEFKNEDTKLKPGMYANVELKVPLGQNLSVSEDSVIDTGERKIAFVAMGDGYFEPREVKVGHKAEGYYEVLGGLKDGEKVVRRAAFLVDSESRLKAALGAFGMPGMSGMEPTSEAPKAAPKEVNISFSTDGGTPKVGGNSFRIILTDMDGNPIKDAKVDIQLYMPPMPAMGMPAMNIPAEAKPVEDGLYVAEVNIPMSGSGQVKVTVTRPGKAPASRVFETSVR
ncbi:MAG: efflux RND transporter periplasmic adaptor subunit [Deltaproteobacteria bacterium]|nr:efflux RND transporter periplasmic adaptor subunit [Deltaproteobacteria bacterium]